MLSPTTTIASDAPAPEAKSRQALGRGLAALIPTSGNPTTSSTNPGLRYLPIETIRPNPQQPRKVFDEGPLAELAASIAQQGVLQPIVVRRVERAGERDSYELVAGERRWRAAQRAGLREIPALIKELSERSVLEIGLIENLQREDLDPIEEALAYRRLLDEHGLTQEAVGRAVGKSRVAIANALRLLKLPPPVLDSLAAGALSPGHARAVMMVERPSDQQKFADEIVARGLTVREAEREAKKHRHRSTKVSPKGAADGHLELRLERALGVRVRLTHRQGAGELKLYFKDLDQLEGLIRRLERPE